MVGTAKVFGVGTTDSCDLRRSLFDHALPCTSEADLVVICSVKVHKDFFLLLIHYSIQCGEKSEVPSALGNMRPSGYCA